MTVNNLFKRSVSSTEDPAILCRQTGQKWEIRMLLRSVEDTCKMLSLWILLATKKLCVQKRICQVGRENPFITNTYLDKITVH